MTPAAAPITNAPIGPTKPEAGVIATSPATAPEQMPTTVGLPRSAHSTTIQVRPAIAVAICVTVIAMPACMPAETAEPALKPNQPTHSSEAPMKVSTTLCPGPLSLRLPSISAVIKPATPELMCTTVPPAKSSTLMVAASLPLLRKPSGPHTQCATGAYTTVAHSAMNTHIDENFMRSANEPAISAGVMIANVIWKHM